MILHRVNSRFLQLLGCAVVLLGLLIAHGLLSPVIAQDDTCPGAPPPRLTVEGRARVSVGEGNNLRLREAAGLSAGSRGRLERGDELNVLSGPVCVDGYYWWQLASDGGLTGWAAEGDAFGYFLAPARVLAPTADPADLTCTNALPVIGEPGDRLAVTLAGQPVDARELPAVEAGLNSSWWAGSVFTILSGPTCGNGLWWWRVTLPNNDTAWIPLGDSAQYYVELVLPTPTPSATFTASPTSTYTATVTATAIFTPGETPLPPPTDTGVPAIPSTVLPTLTPRPTLVPSPTLDTVCWTAPLPRLAAGMMGEIAPAIDALRLRLLPSTGAGFNVLLNTGTRFTVLEGPTCNGGYTWYRVRLEASGETGWVAEGLAAQYWLQPVEESAQAPSEQVCLAWGDANGLHVQTRGVTADIPASGSGETVALRLSPNGRLLAAVKRYPGGTASFGLEVYDLATGEQLFALSDGDFDTGANAPVDAPLWFPDSSGLVVGGTVYLGADDVPAAWQISLYGQPVRLAVDGWQPVAFSSDGVFLAMVREQGLAAALYELADGAITQVIAPEGAPGGEDGDLESPSTVVSWASDGALIVDFYTGQADARQLVQSIHHDPATGVSEVTTLPIPLADVRWSPRGSLVAYTMPGGGFWLSEDLARPGALLMPSSEEEMESFEFAWAPGGGTLIYRSPRLSGESVVALEVEGSVARTIDPPAEGVWIYHWLDDRALLAVSDNASAALVNQPVHESFWYINLNDGTMTPLVSLERAFLGAHDARTDGCLAPSAGSR